MFTDAREQYSMTYEHIIHIIICIIIFIEIIIKLFISDDCPCLKTIKNIPNPFLILSIGAYSALLFVLTSDGNNGSRYLYRCNLNFLLGGNK